MTASVSCEIAGRVPHLSGVADHRRHRRVDDDVARYVQVGDAAVGVDHRQRGTVVQPRGDRTLDGRALRVGKRGDAAEHVGETVVGVHADAVERVAVLREHVGEVRLHRVAEDDRVGDLHHRGLEVDREQHALRLGRGHLLGEERVEVARAHEGGVDDLTGEDGDRLLQHGDGAVARHELDPQVVVGGER